MKSKKGVALNVHNLKGSNFQYFINGSFSSKLTLIKRIVYL